MEVKNWTKEVKSKTNKSLLWSKEDLYQIHKASYQELTKFSIFVIE